MLPASLPAAELSALLAQLYQGPTEPVPWTTFLESLRQRLTAAFVTLVLRHPATDRPGLIVNASDYGPHLPGEPSYSEQYYALCPFLDLHPDRLFSADELFGESGWLTHPFHVQYLQPLGLRYILAANLVTPDGVECALFISRTAAGQDFTNPDKALLQDLLPHLKRAVDLHAALDVLASERSLYADAVDRMQVGTVILDEHGRCIRSNDVAGRLLRARDGLYLADGALHAHCPMENRRFRKILESAAQAHALATPRSEVTTLSRPAAPTPLSVLVRPIPLSYRSEDKARRPAVAVFIRDPAGSPRNTHASLRKLFHLTPTEIELALLMVDGLTLDEAAARLGVKKNTARAHLRGIFAKTGATRQAVLVKMLLSSVVGMG
ncbi:putative transcriptionat regulator, LuxR family [Cupriavidus taiwanensis]|uniref:helix-turn-helix transcriptional regulator n=1 Tax=Cupriavidus taiwanensis TaxID=164546 RepID=UPI000E17FF9E|nr:helix-turn-helix transcriptional regulator [Cupriavidus taiwanensis]SOZ19425.1 putative transcriptionat regulator, LuxR family [Cupriavidus taiwanensis]SOZ32623.1 putative transcriptionat regulator, LuxR family [Cupriavidus taiwanensis]SOZ48219.1 putative transcriptionat regulator, LuxR family [Cupriavidus taiwanensis]